MTYYYMIGQIGCTYCDMAKELIKEKGGVVTYYSLEDSPIIKEYVKSKGFRTVPQIWVDEKHVGGYTELQEYFSNDST